LGRGKETGEGKVSNTWVSASQMMLDQKKDWVFPCYLSSGNYGNKTITSSAMFTGLRLCATCCAISFGAWCHFILHPPTTLPSSYYPCLHFMGEETVSESLSKALNMVCVTIYWMSFSLLLAASLW
jgi:hypothetical protein